MTDGTAPPPPPADVPPLALELTLHKSGGRHVALAVPGDMTPLEVIELIGWISNALPDHLAPRSPIIIARGSLTDA